MTAAKLYTPEVLALATSLARWPFDPGLPLTGEARSPTCGSVTKIAIATSEGRIVEIGIRAQACAIGQGAAAIFAQSAVGLDATAIAAAHQAIVDWLNGGALPDWRGFAAIGAARAYPARHGAILLPWTAALAALGAAQPHR